MQNVSDGRTGTYGTFNVRATSKRISSIGEFEKSSKRIELAMIRAEGNIIGTGRQ
jgi:hypothetical protein